MWDFLAANWTNALVLVVMLACPLMHLFGHGHRHRSGSDHGPRER